MDEGKEKGKRKSSLIDPAIREPLLRKAGRAALTLATPFSSYSAAKASVLRSRFSRAQPGRT